MFYEVITGTDIMFYLMIAVGVIGGVAKFVNLFTLRRMARAAGNMSKSARQSRKCRSICGKIHI